MLDMFFLCFLLLFLCQFSLQLHYATTQIGQLLEYRERTVVVNTSKCRASEAKLSIRYILVDTALCANLYAIADCDVVGNTNLACDKAV